MEKANDIRITDQYYFFWNGFCSQWAPVKFIIDGITYNCAEQYMMAQKAILFNDDEQLNLIMHTESPQVQKAAGRMVKNFDPAKWNEISRLVVYRANLAKFGQNSRLWGALDGLGNRIIVEASPYDKIWGIGMHARDEGIEDPKNWKGLNWLGEAIMQVRSDLKQLDSTYDYVS